MPEIPKFEIHEKGEIVDEGDECVGCDKAVAEVQRREGVLNGGEESNLLRNLGSEEHVM